MRILDARLHRWGATLPAALHEDALAFLMLTSLELEQRYDARIGRLSGWLGLVLPLRLATWYRRTIADTRRGEQPPILVDDLGELEDVDGRDFEDRLLEQASARALLDGLSPAGMDTLRQLVVPLAQGVGYAQLRASTGLPQATVTRRIRQLRAEVIAGYHGRTRGA